MLIVHWATYGTRPLWDKPASDFQRIDFRVNPGLNFSSPEVCKYFGWTQRKVPVKVYDAVIFSIEIGELRSSCFKTF